MRRTTILLHRLFALGLLTALSLGGLSAGIAEATGCSLRSSTDYLGTTRTSGWCGDNRVSITSSTDYLGTTRSSGYVGADRFSSRGHSDYLGTTRSSGYIGANRFSSRSTTDYLGTTSYRSTGGSGW